MHRLLAVIFAAALLGLPTSALGSSSHGSRHAARHVARQQCQTERQQTGKSAFRQKYGPHHAFAKCVRTNRPSDRVAAQACRAERKQLGAAAFRQRYGTPHALRRCIAQKMSHA